MRQPRSQPCHNACHSPQACAKFSLNHNTCNASFSCLSTCQPPLTPHMCLSSHAQELPSGEMTMKDLIRQAANKATEEPTLAQGVPSESAVTVCLDVTLSRRK